MSVRDRNPFTPSNGIIPPYLAGRNDILNKFSDLLDKNARGLPKNIILYGLRGVGKTVLLETFEKICEDKNWLFVSREFNEKYRDEEEFAEALTRDITKSAARLSLRKKMGRFGKKVWEYAKPEELGYGEISYKPFYKTSDDLEDHLRDHFVNNWKAFKKSNGLVFLYDEFHTVVDGPPNNMPITSMLAALANAQRKKCKYILVVSGLPELPRNMEDAKTYVERMFEFIEIGNLEPDDAKRAIVEPLKSAHIEFEDALIDAIIKETGGYPYFIQFYCYNLIDKVNKSRISLSAFTSVRKQITKELDISFFKGRFAKASELEQDVLLAMASINNSEVSPSEVAKKCKKHTQIILNIFVRLMEKHLIYRVKRGKYAFALPLFKEFLLRQ